MGKQDHGNQLLRYYCTKCDILLKETNLGIGLSNSKEECPSCGSLVSETLRKGKKKEELLEIKAEIEKGKRCEIQKHGCKF